MLRVAWQIQSSACRKPEQLIHTEQAKQAGVQVIKRFSGGGTVVTDCNTLFATLIMHSRCDALCITMHSFDRPTCSRPPTYQHRLQARGSASR